MQAFRVRDRLSADQVAQVVTDYQDGVPTTQLTKTYGLGKGSVLALLEEHGVKRRRQPLTEEQVELPIGYYADGQSCAVIAQELGFNTGTVWLALKRAGVS